MASTHQKQPAPKVAVSNSLDLSMMEVILADCPIAVEQNKDRTKIVKQVLIEMPFVNLITKHAQICLSLSLLSDAICKKEENSLKAPCWGRLPWVWDLR